MKKKSKFDKINKYMNVFMSNKKYVLMGVVSVICILISYFSIRGIIELYFSNEGDNTSGKVSNEGFNEEQARKCWDRIQGNLIGKWVYIGGELEDIPFIELYENGNFVSNAWGGDGVSITGQWEFIDGSLTLDFDDENDYWEGFDEEEIEKYSNNGISLQNETNELIVPINYTELSGDFSGECSLDHFHIDMMNYLLYKEVL